MSSFAGTLRKYRQLITVIAGVVIVLALIYGLRRALLPFLIGFVVIFFMNSAVSWVERRFPRSGPVGNWPDGKRRVLAIVIVNTSIVTVFGIFGFFLFNTVIQAFSVLLADATAHWAQAVATVQQMTDSTRGMVPGELRGNVDSFALDAGNAITEAIKANFEESVAQLPAAFSTLLGVAVMPLFVFYVLKDREKLSNSFYSSMPEWAAEHVRNILLIIENVLGRYVRATLTLGAAVGLITLIGLLILRVPLAPLLAVVAGITEMIPSVGPLIGLAIASVVTLALAPEKTVFVIILFVVVQLLENTILVPRVQSGYMGLHPVITIVLLVLGAALAGVWGLILAVPLTATGVQIFRYVRQVVREQNSVVVASTK
ncbi:MAG: AI-2E family transporter [Chloroflexi bacterium]|nr:AI-2E family transporter [Chloroflexota bacterium]